MIISMMLLFMIVTHMNLPIIAYELVVPIIEERSIEGHEEGRRRQNMMIWAFYFDMNEYIKTINMTSTSDIIGHLQIIQTVALSTPMFIKHFAW